MENYRPSDATPEMFPEYRLPPAQFKQGMKVEAVDPLNLATICVATVMKVMVLFIELSEAVCGQVLRYGYIMIRMDGYESDPSGGDWFCYHSSSPFLFPPGFCQRNNINLKPPAGFEGDFRWADYIRSTRSEAAPISMFSHKDNVKHAYKVS